MGQRPGFTSFTFECTGQVNDSALIMRTSVRPSIRQRPASNFVMSGWSWQLHTDSRRTATSAIRQMGQLPAASVTTSGCIGQVHDNGGSGRAAPIEASAASSRSRRDIRTTRSIARATKHGRERLTPFRAGR